MHEELDGTRNRPAWCRYIWCSAGNSLNSQLKLWTNSEIARIRAARVRIAAAIVPFQIDTLVHLSMKEERQLTVRLLHCKREVALSINNPGEGISYLRRRP